MEAEKSVRVCFNNRAGRYKLVNISFGSEKVVHFDGKKFKLHLNERGVLKVSKKNVATGASSQWRYKRNSIIREIRLNLGEASFLGELMRNHRMSNTLDDDLYEWYGLTRTNHFKNIKRLQTKLRCLLARKPTMITPLRVRIPINRTKVEAYGVLVSAFMC